jgi:autotransporter-associated beta strand protein
MSALTYATDILTAADITGVAPETFGPGDDLTVDYGVTLISTGGDITLSAGDNAIIRASVIATSPYGKSVTITAGAQDVDFIGDLTLDGSIYASNVRLVALQNMILSGDITADTLDLRAGRVDQLSGAITAGRLQSTTGVSSGVWLMGANEIAALSDFTVLSGDFALVDNTATLTIDGDASADNISIINRQVGGTIVHASSQTQILRVANAPSYTLSFNGQTTASLAGTASAAEIEAALNGLSTIGGIGGSVAVTGSYGAYMITFGGALAGPHPPPITATPSSWYAWVDPTGPTAISGHTIELIADQMTLNVGTITATDTMVLAPATSGTAVSLGDFGSAGLALRQSELDTLSAPTLTIGKDAAGTVTAGTINIGKSIFSSALHIASETVNLFSLGAVSQVSGIFGIAGGSGTLNVAAGGDVIFATLHASAIGGSAGGYFLVNDYALNAWTVNAITAGGEMLVLNGGEVSVQGALTAHGNMKVAGATLALQADIDAGGGAIGLVSTVSGISQSAGALTGIGLIARVLSAGGDIVLSSADNAIAGHVLLNDNAGSISFANARGYTIGGSEGIGYQPIPFENLLPLSDGAITTAATGSVTLTAGGDIDQAGATGDRIVTGTLNLARLGAADPDVTLDNAFNQIHTLGAVDLDQGRFTLTDAIDLTISGAVTAGIVTITAPTLTLTAGAITSFGAQSYHGAMTLGATTELASKFSGISLDGALDLGASDLHVNAAGASAFSGVISGSGGLFQDGSGTTTLSAMNSYTGVTVAAAGTLMIDGSIAASGQTTVQSGATLGGNGEVGYLLVKASGTLAPGDSLGTLATGHVSLSGGSTLAIEIGGKTGLYDQLAVHGDVVLFSPTLDASLVNGFAPTAGTSFTIIDNDGKDAVNGTFAGLDEGATFNVGGTTFAISYHGGDGNDVTLTAPAGQTPAAEPHLWGWGMWG